jgi:hypothetical protein
MPTVRTVARLWPGTSGCLFAELTTRKLRRSAHRRVTALEATSAAASTSGTSSGASPNSPPGTPLKSVEQITPGFDGDRWFTAPEAVAYDMADEVIGGPAGAPESGTPA